MIDHRRAAELAATALDFSLSPEERSELALHLRACPTCAALDAALRWDDGLLKDLPSVDAPPETREALAWSADHQVRAGSLGGRPFLLLAAALLVAAAAVGTVVAGSFLIDRDSRSLLPNFTPTATPSVRPEVSPSEAPEPSAESTPVPLSRLTGNAWALVQADALNVRAEPRLSANRLGGTPRGDLVLVVDGAAVEADGLTWYEIHAAPGVRGWAAAGTSSEAYLVQPADGTRRWCGPVDEKLMQFGSVEPIEALPEIILAGLSLPSGLFTAAEHGAAEVAWAGQTTVCADLTISDDALAGGVLHVPLDTCGRPRPAGFPGWFIETGDVSVSPTGASGRRDAWLNEALVGFEMGVPPDEWPPLGHVISEAESFEAEVCFEGLVTGSSNGLEVSTEVCAFVLEVGSNEMLISPHDPNEGAIGINHVPLPAGSIVDEAVEESASQRIRLRAANGITSGMHVELVDPSCQTAT